MLKRFSSLSLSFFVLIALPLTAMAQGKADFKKPMEVESSHEQFDIKNNKLVLTDNVVIRQGTLLIKADRLEASASESGEQADTFIAEGSPATYTQTLENGNDISAQANKITYFQVEQRLELSGDAKISQGTSSSSGDTIVYDLAAQTISASSSDADNGRVITIFTPKTKDDKTDNENP
ncbi:lipopolysaccharide transport periplasmic protein LptA [Idiomarina sp. X4]|uniref:lipopolysaccharide transport periplasmic protein LptA n=1 Tax=unclassified Idiomarina TaxID=2614829 RepID=UPI000C28D8DF|nr:MULTISPECIES: lipopolysaccharide transport periplasmic protein LptA [unclassified Idiomarina]ATZ72853.1 lipopolysaccharide transport periplasmic protein LptA [Idiomarina sp. X4]RXS43162.1 lipopolysaccharide transport periplasmic protein LptA [Idiomarina sp. 29L]